MNTTNTQTTQTKSRLGRNPFQPKAQVLKTSPVLEKASPKKAKAKVSPKVDVASDTETHWVENLALQAITFTIFAFVVAKTVFEKTIKN